MCHHPGLHSDPNLFGDRRQPQLLSPARLIPALSPSVPICSGPPAPAHSAVASLRAFAPEYLVSWNICPSPRPVSRVSSCRCQLRHCLPSEITMTCITPCPQASYRASHHVTSSLLVDCLCVYLPFPFRTSQWDLGLCTSALNVPYLPQSLIQSWSSTNTC